MPHDVHNQVLLTIVTAISLGTVLTTIARRVGMSAIVLLLLGGVVAGPQGLGLVQPDSLQMGLRVLVSFSIGLILFEGGLTLDVRGYRLASGVILRLLTVGLLVTWFVTAVCLRLVFDFSIAFCLTAASLVIVTGPTVMVPLLKRIRIQPLLHHILHWEAVLIDPIGVFVAVLCFEYIGGQAGGSVVTGFAMRVLAGLVLGAAGGFALLVLIRRHLIDEELIELGPLALAALVFGLSELVASESGLLATTVAGLILGASGIPELKQLRRFKGLLTDLLIGVLFILLAARLKPSQFEVFGWEGVAVVAAVMFVVRPLNILVSTLGEPLNWRQRVFLGWVAPRGIVAASMSSLVALSLEAKGIPQARFIESFTYAVIVGTVLLQGLSAGWLADRLRLRKTEAMGWLIVGAHLLGRRLARFIQESARVPVILLDSNPKSIGEAVASGLPALRADARDTQLLIDRPGMESIGNLLAITDNEDLNTLLCQRWADVLNANHVFGWHTGIKPGESPIRRVGRMIWSNLPKPSIISGDLQRDMAVLRVMPVSAEHAVVPNGSLAIAYPHMVLLDPVVEKPSLPMVPAGVLVLERRGSYLLNAIREELLVESEATTLDGLLDELLERLVTLVPRLPAKGLRDELLERERVMPSSVGHGVAIPHAYSKAVPGRICAIARMKSELAIQSLDNKPVHVVFLLLGPPGDPEGHLALIAEIAKLMADPQAREQFLAVRSYSELVALLQGRQPTSI